MGHLEFIRFNGRIAFAGLPLVVFTTEARLEEIIAEHEAMGAMIFNPHRYTLEEGGMKQTDASSSPSSARPIPGACSIPAR